MLARLSAPGEGAHLQKEAVVFRGPLILVVPISGLHIDLDQLITVVATSKSSFYFLVLGTIWYAMVSLYYYWTNSGSATIHHIRLTCPKTINKMYAHGKALTREISNKVKIELS